MSNQSLAREGCKTGFLNTTQNSGRVFTRLELLDRVQGDAYEGYERTIDTHIKNLRAKLGDDPRRPEHIQTVYGVGYKLEAGA